MTALTATLMLCACSDTAGTPTAAVTTASPSPSTTSVPRSTPARGPIPTLRVPGRLPGEISRTVITQNRGPLLDTTTLHDPRAGDRDYVVKAACSAKTATTLTYVLVDARESSASRSEEERTISGGDIPCDGTLTVNSAGPLPHAIVTVNFRAVPEDVSQAYAVLIPE